MGPETFEAEGLTGMEVDGDLDVATARDKEALLEGDGLKRIFLETGSSRPELHLPHFHKCPAAVQLHGASVHHPMTCASVEVKSLPITLIHSS